MLSGRLWSLLTRISSGFLTCSLSFGARVFTSLCFDFCFQSTLSIYIDSFENARQLFDIFFQFRRPYSYLLIFDFIKSRTPLGGEHSGKDEGCSKLFQGHHYLYHIWDMGSWIIFLNGFLVFCFSRLKSICYKFFLFVI